MKILNFLKPLQPYKILIYVLVIMIFVFTVAPFSWLIIPSFL